MYRHRFRFLVILSACCSLAAIAGPVIAQGRFSKAAIYRRIDALRATAAGIRLDGRDADWRDVPAYSDAAQDAGGDAARDIVEVSIAPREDDLLLRIKTRGRPSREPFVYWFNVDLWGHEDVDLQIGLGGNGRHKLWLFKRGSADTSKTFEGAQYVSGDVVEARLPYEALEKALPADQAALVRGDKARPWLRVSPFTYDSAARKFVDYGAAVACFRLQKTPFELDPPPAPLKEKPRAKIELPLNGKWYIGQGPFGIWSHQDVYAYDFYQVDNTLHPARVRDSKNNEDYYCWNQTVFSPARARVMRARNDEADHPPTPGKTTPRGRAANEVYLDLGRGIGLSLIHHRRGSAKVRPGQLVSHGAPLAAVGNSGSSTWPHLHLAFWRLPEGRKTEPVALSNVRVSLNSASDDVWTWDERIWEPREGLFVERQRRIGR